MVSSHPGWIHAFSQSAANNSVTHHRRSASILPFGLIFFVKSFIIFIHCCCFISSPSVDSSCLLCRRCKLYSLNKAKILAKQSSLHFLILFFLLLRSASTPAGRFCPLFCCPRLSTCPGPPLPFFQPNSSSIDLSRPDSYLSVFSFLVCLRKSYLPFLSSPQ